VQEIVQGHRLALERQFLGPVLFAIALFLVFLFCAIIGPLAVVADTDASSWVLFWLALIVMLAADLVALFWTGLWQAIKSRGPQRAANASAARILVLPWIVFALVFLLMTLSNAGSVNGPGELLVLGLWFFIGICVDIVFAARSRQSFLTRFRQLSAARYDLSSEKSLPATTTTPSQV
jgi:cation transport ATPase